MKKIISIVLILCVVGAWGSIISKNINIPKEYDEYLSKAKQAYSQEYYLEALNYAGDALTVEGIDSVYEADVMQRDSYYGLGNWSYYEQKCQSMIAKYPEIEENYELLVQHYVVNEDIRSLCECIDTYYAAWPENETIRNAKNLVDASYRYIMRGCYDIKYASATVVDVQTYEDEIVDEKEAVVRKLVNSKGSTIFDCNYSQISVAQDGSSCFVCDQEGNWKKVNINDYLLAKNPEVSFDYIGRLSTNGIAKAVINGEYHFINSEMKVSDLVWEDTGTFYNGINGVKKNGKWALVTTDTWSSTTEFPYTDIPFNSQDCCVAEGYCVVADSTGYKILETEEFTPVTENVYEELKAFESNQPTAYRKGDKWGFVNRYGNVYIEAEYEDAKPFFNGYAAVKVNGLWGYIDSENKMVVEPQFKDALNVLSSGYAYVQNELGVWDYIILDKLFYLD